MKKLLIIAISGMMAASLWGQARREQAQKPDSEAGKEITSILGVQVGMTMEQTLKSLQERSKRFHSIPRLSTDSDSLTLLTNLQMEDVRLGWQEGSEMIASSFAVTFYHGKVVRLICISPEHSKREWDVFLRKIPKVNSSRVRIDSDGKQINPIEFCQIGEMPEEKAIIIIRDTDAWNSYIDELKALAKFFNSVPRQDEVLD